MTSTLRMLRIALLVAVLATTACSSSAITIEKAWAPPSPAGTTVGAAYLQIVASENDTLLSANAPITDRIEMHASIEENGMMTMRPLPSVRLTAGQPFQFTPGGAHFMLIGLHEPLVAGAKFPLTLQLQNHGPVTVEVTVTRPGDLP